MDKTKVYQNGNQIESGHGLEANKIAAALQRQGKLKPIHNFGPLHSKRVIGKIESEFVQDKFRFVYVMTRYVDLSFRGKSSGEKTGLELYYEYVG